MESLNEKYKAVKAELIRLRKPLQTAKEATEYFTPETFNIIMADRDKAAEAFYKYGTCQDFYKSSETLKTDFYNKNSGSYCAILEILLDMEKYFTVSIKSKEVGGTFEFQERADNEKQAGFFALKDFKEKYPHWKNGIRIDDIRRI